MSREWWDIGGAVFIAITWGLAGFIVVHTGLFTESPDRAFVRGYFHGAYYAMGVVDEKFNQGGELIASFRECLIQDSNVLWQEWLEEIDRETKRDSLANIPDSIYFDSTDTMPALYESPFNDSILIHNPNAVKVRRRYPDDTMPAVEYTHPDSIDTSRVGKVIGGAL